MFKNLIKILYCIPIVGICGAMDKKDSEVENPIPLIIKEFSPDFLQDQQFMAVCDSFEKSALIFKGKCEKVMELPGFPEQLNDMWKEKLQLLKDTYDILKSRHKQDAVIQQHQKLINVTENGFRAESKIAIYEEENSEEFDPILDDFWHQLWQARELTEYLVILSHKKVLSSKIPEICESFDKSVRYIRQFAISENTSEENEALKIEMILNKTLSSYQYMEFGRAFKTEENLASIKKEFKDEKLRNIMMSAFHSE